MPDFHWTQVLALCAVSLFVGYWLATSRWGRRSNIKPPEQQPPGQKFPRSHDTPAVRVLEDQFEQGRLTFAESLELANTYRRKGDVQAAIEIHQSLYGRPGLSWQDQQQAQFELACDFFQAGIHSRAEDLLQSLVGQNGSHTAEAVRLLLKIYRQEQDWEAAIQLFAQHPTLSGKDLQWEHVHVLCEQADTLIRQNPTRARELVKQAMQLSEKSLRPPLLMMQLAMQDNRWREFKRWVQNFVRRDHVRTDLLRPLLMNVAQQHPNELPPTIHVLQQHNEQADVRLLHGELLCELGQPEQGIQLIRSVPLSSVTLRFQLHHLATTQDVPELAQLADDVTRHQSQQTQYQCGHCGYESHGHHWHCPQCNRWESMSPSRKQNSKLLI